MFFARYFPGLGIDAERLNAMTLEESVAMRRAGQKFLDHEAKVRTTHTVGIMRAAARA